MQRENPWFYVSTGTGWYHHDKCWNDDLDIPLSAMGIYIEKIRKGDNIDRPTKEHYRRKRKARHGIQGFTQYGRRQTDL